MDNIIQFGITLYILDFITYGVTYGDSFELQLSTNNGGTYHTVNTFRYSTDFDNSNKYDYSTTLEGSFGSNNTVRIIGSVYDHNANIFIDNISIGSCPN